MKQGSDNFRKSAVFDIIDSLINYGIKVIVYELLLKNIENNIIKVDCLNSFKAISDLIICNRITSELSDVTKKVYTRDIFGID